MAVSEITFVLLICFTIVPHSCKETELHPFCCIVSQEKGMEAAPFAKRVPTLPKGGTGYFAAGSSLRSSKPTIHALKLAEHIATNLGEIWVLKKK